MDEGRGKGRKKERGRCVKERRQGMRRDEGRGEWEEEEG